MCNVLTKQYNNHIPIIRYKKPSKSKPKLPARPLHMIQKNPLDETRVPKDFRFSIKPLTMNCRFLVEQIASSRQAIYIYTYILRYT